MLPSNLTFLYTFLLHMVSSQMYWHLVCTNPFPLYRYGIPLHRPLAHGPVSNVFTSCMYQLFGMLHSTLTFLYTVLLYMVPFNCISLLYTPTALHCTDPLQGFLLLLHSVTPSFCTWSHFKGTCILYVLILHNPALHLTIFYFSLPSTTAFQHPLASSSYNAPFTAQPFLL